MKTIKTVRYSLRNKKSGKYVEFSTQSNADGDFCCETQYLISESYKPLEEIIGNELWIVDSYAIAEKARTTHTEWYNAGYETPSHYYKRDWNPDDYEVVRIEMVLNVEKA